MRTGRAGFTLIELLVVIGIIAVMAGFLAIGLRGGDRGVALQAGQATLNSLLAGARAKAALNQQSASVVVDADPTSEGFLRHMVIAVHGTGSTSEGTMAGDFVTLPAGIYLVPPSAGVPGLVLADNWPGARRSTAFNNTRFTLLAVNGAQVGGEWRRVNTLTVIGTTSNAGKLVLGAGERRSANEVYLTSSEQLRGLQLSQYGVAAMVNDAAGFN
jgi:prepilin-type N-terminal cleavage/methylation domain-containing protein